MTTSLSLRKIIANGKKQILNKTGGQFLLSSVSLLTLAACGGATTGNLNVIAGSSGADAVSGTQSKDVILALGGDDVISGSDGNDVIDGGDGIDTVDYSSSNQAVYAYLDGSVAGQGDINGFDLDSINNVENLEGSAFDDVLVGNAYVNVINGGGGDDQISGLAGDDVLNGGLGDDVISGGAGADQVDGGDGIDWAAFGGTIGVTAYLDGTAGVGGEAEGDVYVNVENMRGTEYVDNLTGNAGANIIQGLGGNDVLNGADGNDQLDGGVGDDEINGGEGIDLAVIKATSFDYVINFAAGEIKIDIVLDSVVSADTLNSIETLDYYGSVIDIKDIWSALDSVEQAKFSDLEANFTAWLGDDAGYNYDGLP